MPSDQTYRHRPKLTLAASVGIANAALTRGPLKRLALLITSDRILVKRDTKLRQTVSVARKEFASGFAEALEEIAERKDHYPARLGMAGAVGGACGGLTAPATAGRYEAPRAGQDIGILATEQIISHCHLEGSTAKPT